MPKQNLIFWISPNWDLWKPHGCIVSHHAASPTLNLIQISWLPSTSLCMYNLNTHTNHHLDEPTTFCTFLHRCKSGLIFDFVICFPSKTSNNIKRIILRKWNFVWNHKLTLSKYWKIRALYCRLQKCGPYKVYQINERCYQHYLKE